MHNIVIIGGNFSGVSIAHYLLRHVLPVLREANNDYAVTLISPSNHTFFKVGAPRALISDQVPNTQLFASITDAFKGYKSSEFTFIQGTAVAVDEHVKTVTVSLGNSGAEASTQKDVQYSSLVIATGTTSASPLWTLHGEHLITTTEFANIQAALAPAKTVLIAGGGPSGVETAGEIGHRYKDKEITILSGSKRLLSRMQNGKPGAKAEKQLTAMNVHTVHNVRVTSFSRTKDDKQQYVLNLSDGTIKVVDVFIDATGGAPNTNFLPVTWLDSSKRIITDPTTLRATNAPAGVYAIGDVTSFSKGNIPDATWAVKPLGYSIWLDLSEKNGTRTAALKEKQYSQIQKDMGLVPVGPGGGVGAIFGWSVPSWFVWLVKSRTFLLENSPKLAQGAEFEKP